MGNRLIWEERYNIGVDIIDREHKKLFSILNKLFAFGHSDEKSQFACQEAIKYFKDHAVQHFADEEAYMDSIHYPGLAAHKRIHRDFRKRMLPALDQELKLKQFSPASIQHFLGVCAGWLIGHTLIEDRLIVTGESVVHWDHLLPEEELAVMGQTLASLLHGMFRLDSQLVSICYTGEHFGNEICCRLVYDSKDHKRFEFFMLFEEQLIGSTIGNVIDAESETTDMMLSNVTKYAAKQLAERFKQQFTSLAQFELTSEHLLSYEQFYKMYEKISPRFSLLFDTGSGYFACCMASPETPLHKEGLSAVTADAVARLESGLTPGKPLSENRNLPQSQEPQSENRNLPHASHTQAEYQNCMHADSLSDKALYPAPCDNLQAESKVCPHPGYSLAENSGRTDTGGHTADCNGPHRNNFTAGRNGLPYANILQTDKQKQTYTSNHPDDSKELSYTDGRTTRRNDLPYANTLQIDNQSQPYTGNHPAHSKELPYTDSRPTECKELTYMSNPLSNNRGMPHAAVSKELPYTDTLPANSQEYSHADSTGQAVGGRKKKILVVDDSDFMRTAMLHLLGRDYEVFTADSGLSAIRSITLARPDLVLLDYEMPVCSGSQMLEMIRSEKDFTDIPVIFLTCRVDRASVQKVISLKPEGYLSKSLPAESVKREIDRFFEKKG